MINMIIVLDFYDIFMNTNGCVRYIPPGVDVEESSLVKSLPKLLCKHSVGGDYHPDEHNDHNLDHIRSHEHHLKIPLAE